MIPRTDILVMDDNVDLCQMMETVLRFEGFNVVPCTKVALLISELATHRPVLLIMDMLLSGSHGSDICRELKTKPDAPKILMISAHPDAEKICLAAGADDFLNKPFDLEDFTRKVKALLKLERP